jgi:hypothetical protein
MAVIGIDIDGTLAKGGSWAGGDVIPEPNTKMAALVVELFTRGHMLYAWSCRADYVVKQWLKRYHLIDYFMGINRSPYPTESGKASFDFYIGDEAIRWDDNPQRILALIHTESQKKGPADFERDKFFSSHNPKPYFAGVGKVYVDMFEDAWRGVWHRRKIEKPTAFMTICSHAKPYSKSFIHTSIRKALHEAKMLPVCDYIHISNAGIIPASAEMEYPFNAYDWNGDLCTPEVKDYHISAIKRRFKDWLDTYGASYERIVIYLRHGGNTFNAVSSVMLKRDPHPELRTFLVPALATERHYPKFVHTRDPDDCLTHQKNLDFLIGVMKV